MGTVRTVSLSAVTKGYRYPEDEFDAEPAQDAPIGVHRAPRTWWSRWWPFVAVLVLVPALTVGGVLWYSSRGGTLPGITTGGEPGASAPASEPAPSATTEAPGEAPAAPEETPETPEPTADLAATVRVLNAANISGLAAGAAEQLEGAGFTAVTTGNGNAGGGTTSTVFYATADQEVTARQVAATLGITAVVQDADVAGDAVVVLLLRDFAR